MLPGKKVTDSGSVAAWQHGGAKPKDINWAWDTIGKVRSEIRRMEHRLDDPDLRLPPPSSDLRLFQTGRELDQTYTVRDQLLGAAAAAKNKDKYDYSAYQRSKTAPPGGRRKVSRLDEKYNEDTDSAGRLGSRRADRDQRSRGRDGYGQYHGTRDVKMGSPKRVDFSHDLHLREVKTDGTYQDSVAYQDSSSSSQSLDVPSTLTDSRAIRETDLRFLNDYLPSTHNHQDVRWGDVRGKPTLTRVNVQVPSGKESTRTRSESAPSNFRVDTNDAGSERRREDHEKRRHLKKSLKDLPDDSELFVKLKEKIRQQRLSASASSASTSDTSQDSILGIVPLKQETDRQPRVRKVAPGPPVPVYRGFADIPKDFQVVPAAGFRHQSKSPVPKKKVKKVVGKLQRKTAGDQNNESGSSAEKPKKLRIIAGEKEAVTKTGAKSLITTSSWRAGQQLILQTLGPAKSTKKSSQNKKSDGTVPEDEDVGEEVRRPDGAENYNFLTSGNREGAVGSDAETKTSKILSENAKRILSDLQLNQEDDSRPAVREEKRRKRKAPKPSEQDKSDPTTCKHRHYDQSKVRNFIAKQRAERNKRKKEQEKALQMETEKRRKQLEELYNRQKPKEPAQVRSRTRTKKSQQADGGTRGGQQRDVTFDLNGDAAGFEMEADDDDSTLTDGLEEDVTPTGTPRDHKDDIQPTRTTNNTQSTLTVGGQKLNLDVNAVLSKFSEIVNRQKVVPSSLSANYEQPKLESSRRTQADRIRAVKETSATLQSKLAVSKNIIDAAGQNLDAAPLSRYERMIGSHNEYRVFGTDLPGYSGSTNRVRSLEDPDRAATRIQAAYRGHTVRQSMNWPLPSGKTLASRLRSGDIHEEVHEESSITETSTFSDITITEDSENESMNSPLAKHSKEQVRCEVTFKPTSKYNWEEPRGDPLSVINIYQRKMKNRVVENDRMDPLSSLQRESAMNTMEARHLASQGTVPQLLANQGAAVRSLTNQGYGSGASYKQALASRSAGSQQTETTSKSSVFVSSERGRLADVRTDVIDRPRLRETNEPFSLKEDNQKSERSKSDHVQNRSESYRPVRESITDDSCTHSVSEDEDRTPTLSKPSSRHVGSRHDDKRSEVIGHDDSDASLVSDDDVLRSRLSRHDLPPPQRGSGEPGRFSPNTLEQKMYAELNRLESMEQTLHQLTNVDRTRAVSMAQQETVSLAQMLKARKQNHEQEMRQLKLQAQKEVFESSQQLDDLSRNARRAGDTVGATGGAASRLSDKDIQALKKEAIKAAAQAWNLPQTDDTRRPVRAQKEDTTKSRFQNKKSDRSEATESVSIRRPKKPSSVSYSVSKTQMQNKPSRSAGNVPKSKGANQDSDTDSIHTASDADARDVSRVRSSIQEDLHDDDYTMSYDDSMTEDESFRQVLPSESHRKEAKRRHGDASASMTVADETASGSRLGIGDLSSLFVGEDNFSRFTAEMVRQIMREEELRAQHQAALLRLREKALKEKTKVELAWIKQQKQLRTRGSDDKYPQILKQERSILKRQKEQQEEIRRLQEANKLASRERQHLLQQHEEIAKLRQSTHKTKGQLKDADAPGRLNRPEDIHTEDEVSALDDASDASEDFSQSRDYKSDSEVYGAEGKRTKGDKQKIDKQMKNRLDQKYLTSREQKLLNRRKNAEELLAWKQRLDDEEHEVFSLEKKALNVWGDEADGAQTNQARPPSRRGRPRVHQEYTQKKAAVVSNEAATPRRDETTVSEQLTTARDDSVSRTRGAKSEAISTQISASQTERSGKRSRDEHTRSPAASGSEGSIPEELTNRIDDGSSPEKSSAVDDYNNDTFEQDTTVTSRKKSPVGRFLPQGSPLPSPWSRKGGSESESEESISHTETLSDASDYEARIRQLSDELRRRRREAELLKKDRKKRNKERMRAQEDSLKKQIEAYDNYINQLRCDKNDLEQDVVKTPFKPQIKQPKVTTGKSPKSKQDVSPSKRSQDAEHNQSSSFEDIREGSESSHTSPSLSEPRDWKSPPVQEDKSVKKQTFLDRISEGSESDKSGASKKKENVTESSLSEAIEEISAVDEPSVSDKIGIFQVHTDKPTEADSVNRQSLLDDEPSYSMTFTDAVSVSQDQSKLPHSVSKDKRELGAVTRDRSDVTLSEQIEEAFSVKSDHSLSLQIDLNKESSVKTSEKSYVTGIPESDSDNEKSHQTTKSTSRPSSEKSVASTIYSQGFEDEDLSESERTPVLSVPGGQSVKSGVKTEEEISEHIPSSLPSISEKKHTFFRQESLDSALEGVLGGLEDEDDEKTPTETPREATSPLIGEDESNHLLLTDPLADYNIGDRVLVAGQKKGTMRFKGKVDFSPGIWAGVELDKPEGDMNGFYAGHQYFVCGPQCGLLVPGSDISPVAEIFIETRSPNDSITDASATTDTEQEKEIESAVTPSKKAQDKEVLADSITNQLTASIVQDSVDAIGKIAAKQSPERKLPPPTLPKPKLDKLSSSAEKTPPESDEAAKPSSPKEMKAEKTADIVMDKMLNEAISEMVSIRNKQRSLNDTDSRSAAPRLVNGHVTKEELDGLARAESGHRSAEYKQPDILVLDDDPDFIQRPESPLPVQGLNELDHDISDLLGDDSHEYFDDDMGLKPPPPYQSKDDQARGEVPRVAPEPEEVVYVVPHQRDEIDSIVEDAIEVFWNCRRYGEDMENVEPPENFFRSTENGRDMESCSKRNFKRLLFDLTGEIIREIYKDENAAEPAVWQKPKRKLQKYYKGQSPPTTKDKLTPVVVSTVGEIMGLNGARNSDQSVNKWNIRKKRDNVDNILVQELREEEPSWVNYDNDELSVKMQLTDTILDSLLADTVNTFNKIFQKRHYRSQQSKM